jgi:hypothetical protein
MVHPWVEVGAVGFQIWRIVANICSKRLRTADKEWSSSFGVRKVFIPKREEVKGF